MKNFSVILLFLFLTAKQNIVAQSLDQQLRQASEAGVLPSNVELSNSTIPQRIRSLTNLTSQKGFFNTAPQGITSLINTSEFVEQSQTGNLTVYTPKGYGNNSLHYGIWNAIPFVVFDNSTMELRLGLIFENRQIGFVPEEWVSTSMVGQGLPEISFFVPPNKTFLNYANGTSQWRATVLLTEQQIASLKQYSESNPNVNQTQDTFTITHRFIDSTTRPYILGVRNKNYFKIMIQLYEFIGQNPVVKKFSSTDAFPGVGFFDEVLTDTSTTNPTTAIPEATLPAEEATDTAVTDQATEEEIVDDAPEEAADGYADEYAYDEEYTYDDGYYE